MLQSLHTSRCPRLGLLILAIALGPPLKAAEHDNPPAATLVAGRVLQPDGTLRADTAIHVRNGRIEALGPAAEARGEAVRRFGANTVICPGLIDLFSSIGAVGQTAETVSAFDPGANAADALDPRDPHFPAGLRAGITAALVAPSPDNLVGGACVCFRTFVDRGRLDVLRADGPLAFSLGEGVWRGDRLPTSRAGAVYQLRKLLTKAERGEAHPRVDAALAGQLDAVLICKTRHDVASARQVFADRFGRFAVALGEDAVECADDLGGRQQPVVVGPYSFTSERRVLLGAAELAGKGIEVAFRGGFPQTPPDGLRLTAALAVRHGLDPAAARRALTVAPARVAGVADRIGMLTPGKEADLVVFSQDPLRLDAAVLEVYVKGVRVYAADRRAPGGKP